jgi:hypothetical protein
MARPFTLLAALLLFVVAAAHGYRILNNWDVIIGPHNVPMMGSWIGGVVAAFLGVMLLRETTR